MKKLGIYISLVLVITILLPTVIVKTFYFTPKGDPVIGEKAEEVASGEELEEEDKELPIGDNSKYEYIKIYNSQTNKIEEIKLDEYIKGVVAAEMPAAFHIEALRAQAVAARTYAISRSLKFQEGHPDHLLAPLCNREHCQAYLSFGQLQEIHGDKWIEDYWGKIEDAVETTKGLAIFYDDRIIEPLYHSTSGGRTEDVKDVFAVDLPYLKSVTSPYEEEAPKYNNSITLSIDDFIKLLSRKYPDLNLDKDNLENKIKLIERSLTGRVKKIAIDGKIMEGRELRDLLALNSTNFTISLDKKLKIIEIETLGFGHGVGMSQWGANGMGKMGKNFEEILKHYYSGTEIKALDD